MESKNNRSRQKPRRSFKSTRPKTVYSVQTVRLALQNVAGFSWSSSSTPQSFTFGYSTLPDNVQAIMDQYRYYRVEKFGFYLTVPDVFEHVNFVVAPLPYQTGGTFPSFGEATTKNGSFIHSAQSRMPSIGLQNMPNWRKYCHRVPHSVMTEQPERMFACDPAATDTEPNQFIITLIPSAVTSNAFLMHWCCKLVFHTPTESGVQLKRAIDTDRRLLAKLPIEQLLDVLKEAKNSTSSSGD